MGSCKGTPEDWDGRYSAADYLYGLEPNAFLQTEAPRFASDSRLLLPGDGEGRNSLWLASQGHRVTSVDFSQVAQAKARALAADRGLSIDTICADLNAWSWPEAAFEGVAALYCHLPDRLRPQVHGHMLRALVPGGLLLIEAFHPKQVPFKRAYRSGGPGDRALLYSADDLLSDFSQASCLRLEETETVLAEGRLHQGPCFVTRGLFQRRA